MLRHHFYRLVCFITPILVGIIFIRFSVGQVKAEPVLNPSNGHYYEAIPDRLLWPEANNQANLATFMGFRGHLATITSPEEQNFIVDHVVGKSEWWLGALQSSESTSPDAGWHWVTGEPLTYTNWWGTEPNDGGDNVENNEEDFMELVTSRCAGCWNDLFNDWEHSYIVEYQEVNGDFDLNGLLNAADVDLLTQEIVGQRHPLLFDLNGDSLVDLVDHQVWVKDLKETWIGDADLNGEFNSSDFVQAFQAGTYETKEPAGWSEGDWNGDGIFDSSDFVIAFQDGGYEQGLRTDPAAVPEPASAILLFASLMVIATHRRRFDP